ncbi:MAG: 30S ribosomal protein S6e [Candidatus Thermoplasmatota archaeon]|nr:30S ribosomal protein S6e [Candidatus Thermoplasmatota archaeon]
MPEFKVVVSEASKSYQTAVTGAHANALVGKKIGDSVDGIFVGLPGYTLEIMGGSDKDGFAMRKEIAGIARKFMLMSKSIGFNPDHEGVRKKRHARGNTITLGIVQINMKVTKAGAKPISELIAAAPAAAPAKK